jgi:uncharacterized membrane protein
MSGRVVRKPQGRQYRDPTKRAQYERYTLASGVLSTRLRAGEITQEEFEHEHDELDRRFAWVR